MTHTQSYSYALLDVTPATFAELEEKLTAAGYGHAIHERDGRMVIDLSGIAVREEP